MVSSAKKVGDRRTRLQGSPTLWVSRRDLEHKGRRLWDMDLGQHRTYEVSSGGGGRGARLQTGVVLRVRLSGRIMV